MFRIQEQERSSLATTIVSTKRNSISVTFPDAVKSTEKRRTWKRIFVGTRANGRSAASGSFAGKVSHAPTNSNAICALTRARSASLAPFAISASCDPITFPNIQKRTNSNERAKETTPQQQFRHPSRMNWKTNTTTSTLKTLKATTSPVPNGTCPINPNPVYIIFIVFVPPPLKICYFLWYFSLLCVHKWKFMYSFLVVKIQTKKKEMPFAFKIAFS